MLHPDKFSGYTSFPHLSYLHSCYYQISIISKMNKQPKHPLLQLATDKWEATTPV